MYDKKLINAIKSVSQGEIKSLSSTVLEQFRNGRNIYIIGNGGSAALANHFATDLTHTLRGRNLKTKCLSLSSNSCLITAIANDIGSEHIFSSQLEYFMEPGDLLISISSSGNSPNILNAIKIANNNSCKTFGILGFDGGIAKQLCKQSILVLSQVGEYALVEDTHSFICHSVVEQLKVSI
jgi:D-sedoheptulose 7-phosphate isomerase